MSENDNNENGLPDKWAWSTLVELVAPEANAFTDGPFGSKLKSAHYVDDGVRVIRLGNLGVGEFKHRDQSFVSEAHAETLARHSVEAGDLLIAALAEPVGRCCQVPKTILPAIVKADCIRFKPHPMLSSPYLMHWLNSPQGTKNAEQHSHGVGRLRINMKNMRGLSVPIAPLPEQHRIVAEIETQFTRLDAAVATLEKVQVKLKAARASVLKASVEGRLVPTEADLARAEGWSYEPASVLLDRILAERKAKHDEAQVGAKRKKKYKPPVEPDTEGLRVLPEGWAWVSVEQVFDQRLGKMLDRAKNTGTMRPYLRNANVRWFGFDLADVKQMRVEDGELDQVSVRAGDIVVCEGGEPGRAAVWTFADETFVIQKACHRLRPADGVVPSLYAFVLASGAASGRLARAFTGSTIKHLTGRKLCPFPVPLPPSPEQARIVAEVERRLSVLDYLDATVERNLLRCTRLRQSILKRAFEGKLVPQHPNDESAAELLARIQEGATSAL